MNTPTIDALTAPKYRKRSDVIAHAIKQWITANDLGPGDRLPKEKELSELFKASKSVIRETLKSLEVQGLVTISTGPNGGAMIRAVPESTAMALLSNFFFFKSFDASDIYEMSQVLEPAVSASVVGHLSPSQFEDLEAIVELCSTPAQNEKESRAQLIAEIRFHEVLADACPNAFLSFFCKYMKQVIRDLVVFRLSEVDLEAKNRFTASNLVYHKKLIAAYRREDRTAAHDVMQAHVADVERFIGSLGAVVKKKFRFL